MGTMISRPVSPASIPRRNTTKPSTADAKPQQSQPSNRPDRRQTANPDGGAKSPTFPQKRNRSTNSLPPCKFRRRSLSETSNDTLSTSDETISDDTEHSRNTPPLSPETFEESYLEGRETSPLVRVVKRKETMLKSRWADKPEENSKSERGRSRTARPREGPAGQAKDSPAKQNKGGKNPVKPGVSTQYQSSSVHANAAPLKHSFAKEKLSTKDGSLQKGPPKQISSKSPQSEAGPSPSIPSPLASTPNTKEAQVKEEERKSALLEKYSQELQKTHAMIEGRLNELENMHATMRASIRSLFNVQDLPRMAKAIAGGMIIQANGLLLATQSLQGLANQQKEQYLGVLKEMGVGASKPSTDAASEKRVDNTKPPRKSKGKDAKEPKPLASDTAQQRQSEKQGDATSGQDQGKKQGVSSQPIEKPPKRQQPTGDDHGSSETSTFGIKKTRLNSTELHNPLQGAQSYEKCPSFIPMPIGKHATGTAPSRTRGPSNAHAQKQGTPGFLREKRGADNMMASSSQQNQPLPDDNRYDGQGTAFGIMHITNAVPKRRKMTGAVELPEGGIQAGRKRSPFSQWPQFDPMDLDDEEL
ncbi:hypothetical protein DM02DRAFT_687405 [Periconia macrospinosa]|uniref:Uncharacterized protein n=1 Tax=Periconia macrospinosa TaxID=97972 RepID=A0A2V1DEZ8_9PLEO|nr:hypothetical protein DM02DRAFT_687405 [Periconia macrospinosa]